MRSLRRKPVDSMEQLNMRGKSIVGFFHPGILGVLFRPIGDGLESENDANILWRHRVLEKPCILVPGRASACPLTS